MQYSDYRVRENEKELTWKRCERNAQKVFLEDDRTCGRCIKGLSTTACKRWKSERMGTGTSDGLVAKQDVCLPSRRMSGNVRQVCMYVSTRNSIRYQFCCQTFSDVHVLEVSFLSWWLLCGVGPLARKTKYSQTQSATVEVQVSNGGDEGFARGPRWSQGRRCDQHTLIRPFQESQCFYAVCAQ